MLFCVAREMDPKVIVNFNELPTTFIIKGGRWIKKKSFEVHFEVTHDSISAEVLVTNGFEALQASENKNVNRWVPKTPIAPSNNRVKKFKGQSHRRTRAPQKLISSPALELAKATLDKAAKDLIDSKRAKTSLQVTFP